MTRRHPSGRYPADVIPDHNRPPLIANQEGNRFANIVVVKPTADDRAHALAYLTRTGNTDVADMLGLGGP